MAEAERESRLGRGRHGRGGKALRRWQERFSAREFEALVQDAVWVRYRPSPPRRTRSGALLVAIGVDWGGGFRVLDWQVGETEDADAYLALFGRLYERGPPDKLSPVETFRWNV